MKPNGSFFAIFLLLCLIPGFIFVFLPRTDIPATGGDIPLGAAKAGTNKPLEAQTQNYQVEVEVKKPPLTTGKQVLLLKLTSATLQSPMSDNQASGLPSVQVMMPMGQEMMEADAQVKPTKEPGRYEITTDFSMAGPWDLVIKPSNAEKPLTLKLQVQ